MATRNDLRKIKLTQYADGSGDYIIKGYFHQWSSVPYLTDHNQDFGVTKGIVELSDGEIKLVEPNRIKFVDEF